MRFLDICLNPAARDKPNHSVPYLLIVQGDYVDVDKTRVVIPLYRLSAVERPVVRLMPSIRVGEEELVAVTPQIGAVPVTRIGSVVASAAHAHSAIRRAIDVLTGDF